MLNQFRFFFYDVGRSVTPDAAYHTVVTRLDAACDEIYSLRNQQGPDPYSDHPSTRCSREIGIFEADRSFLLDLQVAIEPHRKFPDLHHAAAMQLVQREEELFALISSAENAIFSMGAIPIEIFAALRAHPDFHDEIFPYIAFLRKELGEKRGVNMRGHSKWLSAVADALAEKYPFLRKLALKEESKLVSPGGVVLASSMPPAGAGR